jgi:competence protein ComEC
LAAALTSFYWAKSKIEIYLGILTVSFAAQIGTMPLSFLFSSGSLFSSRPLGHPLLSFIMTLGILVMVLASFNYVPLFQNHWVEYLLSQQDN